MCAADCSHAAKEYLESLRLERRTLEQEHEMLRRLEADSRAITAAISPDRVGGTGNLRSGEDRLIRMADAAAALQERKRAYDLRRAEALRVIMRLEDARHRLVLGNRYLLGMDWADVAGCIGYEERQMFRVHGAALTAFGEKMSADVSRCQ